ncbi:MAG: hypothetical protein OXH75_15195 [Acidobacteria bacterium]|nr:hypothetical protein [Acidobacteriota bacterium]
MGRQERLTLNDLLAHRIPVQLEGVDVALRPPTGSERLELSRRIHAIQRGENSDDDTGTQELLEAYTWFVAMLLGDARAPGEPLEPDPENVAAADQLWGMCGALPLGFTDSALGSAVSTALKPFGSVAALDPTSP